MLYKPLPSDEGDETVILRAVVFLAIIVLRPVAAWAQAAEATAAASEAAKQISASGPLGPIFVVYVIATGVIGWALWKKANDLQAQLKDVQEKRIADTAGYIERIVQVGADSSSAMEGNNEKVADLIRLINAIFDLLKTMSPALTTVSSNVDRNGTQLQALGDYLKDRLRGQP